MSDQQSLPAAGAQEADADSCTQTASSSSAGERLKTERQLWEMIRDKRKCEKSRRNAEGPHKFWDSQPVPRMTDGYLTRWEDTGPIKVQTVEDVQKDPYPIPAAFHWCEINAADDKEMQEMYELLNENYVEDDDNMFRFAYSRDFLRWAVVPPGHKKEWLIGVRVNDKNHKLVACITAIPAVVAVGQNSFPCAEVNFLCVHKKLRSKRLAPVLIKEITRRINLADRWQAVYTAGVMLPRPISTCRYWHRSLDPKKLVEVGFTYVGHRMTLGRTMKLYRLPDEPQLPGLRPMEERDLPEVQILLAEFLGKFALHPVFDIDECRHWLMPKKGIVYSYVKETDGKVTDMLSFYTVTSTVVSHEKHTHLHAAYSYYNVPTSVTLKELLFAALVIAKKEGYDVFNMLDLMDNASTFTDLKFGQGDGHLHYYLYNWQVPPIPSNLLALVLL